MSKDRTKFAIWNYATSLLFTAATLVLGLFASKMIKEWIGDERFGASRTLTDCFGYLVLLELGLSGAMGPLLARALGQGDRAALRDTLSAGMRSYLGVTVLILAAGLALTGGITWFVPVSPELVPDLRLACFAALLGVSTFVLLPFRSLADAAQRGFRINLLLTAQGVLITVATVGLVWHFPQWGITLQALVISIATTTFAVILCWDGLKPHPGLLREAIKARPGRETWKSLWSLSLPTLLLLVCGRLSLYTDNIILGKSLNQVMVSRLYFTQRLAVIVSMQLLNIGNACWAGLAELHAQGEHEAFRRRVEELMRLVAILALAALGPVLAYSRHFVSLWVGPEDYGGDLVVLAASINAFLMPLLSLAGWCLTGTGKVRRLALPSIFATAINLSASIALTRSIGMAGPLLGTTIDLLGFQVWVYLYLLHREFGIAPGRLIRAVLVPIAWGVPYVAALWWLAHVHEPPGWIALGAEMGLAGLSFLLLSGLLILKPEERAVWRDRIGRLLRPARALAATFGITSAPTDPPDRPA
ncbi:oligosaccharide flippase family protein [soil metagenome]